MDYILCLLNVAVDDHETEYEYEGSDGEEAEVAEGEPRYIYVFRLSAADGLLGMYRWSSWWTPLYWVEPSTGIT